jgi:tetratricopeptide (TPR) repeat protein
VHAGTRTRFEDGFRRIAQAIKLDGWNDPRVDVLRLVRNWLCDESNGQWTMVVDNADDEAVFFDNTSQSRTAGGLNQPADLLSDYLPQSPNGSILVTSRSQAVAHKLIGTHSNIIEVKPMDEDDALSLLDKKLCSTTARKGAVKLVHALDFMPLAITQAAAFIQQRGPRMSVSRYVDEVCRSDQNRARLLKKDVGDSRRDGCASNSIIATWQISFEYIRKHTPTAARLLSLMSMFDRQGIPESLLQEQYEGDEGVDADLDDDIHTLSSFSLINMSADGREFEMHRLVQFSTKKWLELYGELEAWRGTYATLIDASYPMGRHENWPVCRALLPHAQAMVHGRPEDAKALEAWASVLFKAAWYVAEMGRYSKALEMGSAALDVRERVLGAEHSDTLNSRDHLGLVMDRQGQYAEAEKIHRRTLEVKSRVLGEDHPATLTSMANLASTYRHQGRLEKAEKLQLEVMQARKTVLGEHAPDTSNSMANLASTYRYQRRLTEAEKLQLEVVQIRKTVLGEDHPSTLNSIANLASTYRYQGRLTEAEKLQLEVMQVRKTVLGEDHPSTLNSMANLSCTWREQGRQIDAVRLIGECVQLRRRVLGVSHPYYANSLAMMAKWERAQANATSLETVSTPRT